MRTSRQMGPTTRGWILALLAVALLACCGGDEGSERPSATADTSRLSRPASTSRPTDPTDPIDPTAPTSSGATTSTTAGTSAPPDGPDAAEQEVIDRYLGYWEARFEANTGVPDPEHPGLAEYATGAQLDAVVSETRANLESGTAYRQREDPAGNQRVTVVSIDGDHAVVQECFVDDGLVVRQDGGEVVDDDITTHNVRGELAREGRGPWRVSKVQAIQVWEGVAGCALVS